VESHGEDGRPGRGWVRYKAVVEPFRSRAVAGVFGGSVKKNEC
jgi:hypothetical protein